MFRVMFGDGSFLDCTRYHKFLVKTKNEKKYREVTTLELMEELKTTKLAITLPRSNIEYFGGVQNNEAYQYGFVLGDGCVSGNRKVFTAVFEHSYALFIRICSFISIFNHRNTVLVLF